MPPAAAVVTAPPPPSVTAWKVMCEDCPVCLEAMTPADEIFKLPCSCGYNYCSPCVETFVKSSKDDYGIASDGSRQVKVHIMCPQCRGDYPMDIADLLLLRRAYTLGSTVVNSQTGEMLSDSSLNASQLALKRDFGRNSTKQKVDLAVGLYKKVMVDTLRVSNNKNAVTDAESVWGKLFDAIPDLVESTSTESTEGDGCAGPPPSPIHKGLEVDETLFKGLEDFMGHDEKVYLTQLLTSGDPNKLAQASMILNGVLRLSTTSSAVLSNLSFAQTARLAEKIEKKKKSYPLPNHMPGYFFLPTFSKKQGYMVFEDYVWDGSIIPPAKSKKTFDLIYGKHYIKPDQPRSVVIIKSVKGPAGRVGLRKADVVTHINDTEWTGTASELKEHIYELHDRNPEDEISLTVNSTIETSKFLKVRYEMMSKDKNLNQ